MNFNFVIYELSTGRIMRGGSISSESSFVCPKHDPTTHAMLPIKADMWTQYIADGVAVDMGPKPSADHEFDFGSKAWRLNLDAARSRTWCLIKSARDREIGAGLEYAGNVFDSDEQAMHRIVTAAHAVQASPSSIVAWTLADNSYVSLHSADIIKIASFMWHRFQALFEKGQRLREQIQQATTQAQLDAISW